jgi:hypothetical protein
MKENERNHAYKRKKVSARQKEDRMLWCAEEIK